MARGQLFPKPIWAVLSQLDTLPLHNHAQIFGHATASLLNHIHMNIYITSPAAQKNAG